MKKTDNFFVISNYNYDARPLLEYCKDYIIYDQSDKKEFIDMLSETNYVLSNHSGHNISDYFTYFIEYYDKLHDNIALVKGNIFPRHLTQDFFDKTYNNNYYTFLFYKKEYVDSKKRSHFLFSENMYLEFNNSWFIKEHPHWYFQSYNELLNFIYVNPINPRYNLYSPGACYIINKSQVRKNSIQFYKNIMKIITYTKPINPFPSEAHQIEWLSHLLYTSNYEMNNYMNDESLFNKELINNAMAKKLSTKIMLSQENEDNNDILLKQISNLNVSKILIIGLHSFREMEVWAEKYPNSTVIGTGILDIENNKIFDDRIKYFKKPLSNFLSSNSDNKFDIIIYEGYHLKGDIENLANIVAKCLNQKGVMYISDVLTLPSMYLKKLAQYNKENKFNLLIYCVTYITKADNIYIIVIEKEKSFFKVIYSKLSTIYSNMHWLKNNIYKYIIRYLPV